MSPCSTSSLHTQRGKRAEPRVPFGTIVELGILAPGRTLTNGRGTVRAEVRAETVLER